MNIKLLIIQYAGDYRETVRRFSAGEDETYYGQKYSVNVVAEIAKNVNEVATLCLMTESSYNEMLENGVRAIGAGFNKTIEENELISIIEEYAPTHLILRTPNREVLRWTIRKKIKTIATLADSFENRGIKAKLYNYQISRLLNHSCIEWIGNHGINASMSLANIGISAEKIIPWDWPHHVTPQSFAAKELPTQKSIWQAIYVGAVIETKGIGDLLRSISTLKSKGVLVHLKVIGKGDTDYYNVLSEELKIKDQIEFLGLQPNKNIIPLMRDADLVVIPSRHGYPEGFPMTIYEALCSRTPIIASNHYMFRERLIHQVNALIFPSGDSEKLAHCFEQLISSSDLYRSLSQESLNTWRSLQIPVKWGELVNCWLFDSSESKQFLFNNRFSAIQKKDALHQLKMKS